MNFDKFIFEFIFAFRRTDVRTLERRTSAASELIWCWAIYFIFLSRSISSGEIRNPEQQNEWEFRLKQTPWPSASRRRKETRAMHILICWHVGNRSQQQGLPFIFYLLSIRSMPRQIRCAAAAARRPKLGRFRLSGPTSHSIWKCMLHAWSGCTRTLWLIQQSLVAIVWAMTARLHNTWAHTMDCAHG